MLEGFGTGNHGCCLEKLTRKRRLVNLTWVLLTVMSFDLSSRFPYTPEASSPHMYFFAFTLFLLGHLGFRQTAVVRSLSFTVSVFLFRTPEWGELPSDGEHPFHHGLGLAGLRVAAELLVEAASARRVQCPIHSILEIIYRDGLKGGPQVP